MLKHMSFYGILTHYGYSLFLIIFSSTRKELKLVQSFIDFIFFSVDKRKEKQEKTSDPIYHILVLSALEPAAVYR
jgi:hypothetical protein